MIFVVLGTQDKPFDRLLRTIDKAVKNGVINEEIIVQAGETNYDSDVMEIRKIIPMNDFDKLIKESSLIICHAGYGILSTALEYGKKVIAAARLSEYGEHHNNHQCEILDYYATKGYILPLKDFSKFEQVYENVASFVPKKFNITFDKLQNLISEFIEE